MSYAADIESIFNPRNLDEDCSYIAHLLSPYEKLIVARMDAGDYTCAVTVFLEILETLTRHFVADEHYTYFDDMYSPEYVCDGIMQAMNRRIEQGLFPIAEQARLKAGLEQVKQSEACQDYGVLLMML